MARPYAALRGLMVANDITQAQMARKLRIGTTLMTQRFNNRKSWTLDDCYKVLSWFGIPPERLPEFFPPVQGN